MHVEVDTAFLKEHSHDVVLGVLFTIYPPSFCCDVTDIEGLQQRRHI